MVAHYETQTRLMKKLLVVLRSLIFHDLKYATLYIPNEPKGYPRPEILFLPPVETERFNQPGTLRNQTWKLTNSSYLQHGDVVPNYLQRRLYAFHP